ncbi:AFR311Cp [Eremothecium gossypii ATCC 10895]|uniref:AFR311Cp n=1 Tax=Eremothecium gossypii (strain ATCC 10895 / CBS 109.51 / FGSC 9923 / NRRL Y-1056) TaxID=284811 RepID=Q753K1_EREGS|nr:AFR311Cp [Eremothecium gossypii ATCC 10895]AAS53682.1 AFR311Cp [Eremothecium gossypii ATCC 10895]AEY97995.1 FAFR311Cp [Eremothecium gossypii FDAG1]
MPYPSAPRSPFLSTSTRPLRRTLLRSVSASKASDATIARSAHLLPNRDSLRGGLLWQRCRRIFEPLLSPRALECIVGDSRALDCPKRHVNILTQSRDRTSVRKCSRSPPLPDDEPLFQEQQTTAREHPGTQQDVENRRSDELYFRKGHT